MFRWVILLTQNNIIKGEQKKKQKLIIILIFLCALLIILNNYVIAQPTKEQIEAFRSAKTVRIIVKQSYNEAKGVSLPFKNVAQATLWITEAASAK